VTATVTSIESVVQHVRDDCDGLGLNDICQIANITYRQLDYWTRTHRVKCHHHAGDIVVHGRGGSGSVGCWPLSQVKIMKRVRKLLGRGLDLDHAFMLATNKQAAAAMLAELTYIQADLLEEEQ
jgi:hypothetical protein